MPILAKINRINNHASLSLISSAALTQLFSVLSSFNQQLQFLESSLFNLSVLYLVLITCSNLNFLKVLSSLAVLCNYMYNLFLVFIIMYCYPVLIQLSEPKSDPRPELRKNIPYILISYKKGSFKHSVLINLMVMKIIWEFLCYVNTQVFSFDGTAFWSKIKPKTKNEGKCQNTEM